MHAAAWKRKPRQVIFSAKKTLQYKDNTHKMQKMIILLKWTDFRYLLLVMFNKGGGGGGGGGANKAIMLF